MSTNTTDHGYIFTFEGHGQYSPAGKLSAPIDADAHNRQVEAAELAHWRSTPATFAPAYYTIQERETGAPKLYQHWRGRVLSRPVVVKTWLGTELARGTVTSAYGNNMGGRIVRLRVRAVNAAGQLTGPDYVGQASYDADFVRLRRVVGTKEAR